MRPSTVSGRVVTPAGEPVEGAAVYFVSGPVALPDIAQRTGPDGRFALGLPAAGRYRIGVNAPGAPAREQDVDADAGAGAVIELDIQIDSSEEGT